MGDWKSQEWRWKLKNKPVKYWIRDEIEEIVKEEKIDRDRFREFSKHNYKKIIKKFYFAFADYKQYPKIELAYCWLHLRDSLIMKGKVFVKGDWMRFLQAVNNMISESKERKMYVILLQGWVYEGYIKEIFAVLRETDGLLDDFYIVSPDFDWTIAYCDDGECAVLYRV